MTKQTRAYLYGFSAVILWSTVASAFKLTLRHLDYAQLLLYASLTTVVVLAATLLGTGRIREVFRCTREQYIRSLWLGLLNPFVYYLVLFKAYDLLPAQVAQPLNHTWGIALPLLSIPLLRQRIHAREIAAGLVCYTGALIISTGGDLRGFRVDSPLGVALAMGSAGLWAIYWIYNTMDEREPVVGLFLNFLFGTPFVLVYCLVFSDVRVSFGPGLLGAVYAGVVEMALAFVFWLKALKLSENTARVGSLIFVAPFLSLVFIHFLVGEEILGATVVGLALIVAGLFAGRPPGRRAVAG
jgi:drug/metabolite transporter (DMT)-like permease